MIAIRCRQDSEQWDEIRKGIPTSSEFGKILTPAKLKPSASQTPYALKLIAETLPGYCPPMPTLDMERGTEQEPRIVKAYELQTGSKVDRSIGFVYGDENRNWGSSPDGVIVGELRGLECKSAKEEIQLARILDPKVPNETMPQIWGNLLTTGYESWDWISYNPLLPNVIVRVERDEKFEKWRDAFLPAMDAFLKKLNQLKIELGV